MKALFVTDLHGSIWKYQLLVKEAVSRDVGLIINGGDMLPKRGMPESQREFVDTTLDNHFSEMEEVGIRSLCNLGNDDLLINDHAIEELCDRYPSASFITQRSARVGGHWFTGFDLVSDTPFRLKDRNRMDSRDAPFPEQFGPGVLSREDGWEHLPDWPAYARELPTIGEELEKLPRPAEPGNAVYVIHMPPTELGLDQCMDGREVGSRAVRRFIETHQPLLTLHGHIHESPDVSGSWWGKIGRTQVIQPGQMGELSFVVIDLENMEFERYLVRHG